MSKVILITNSHFSYCLEESTEHNLSHYHQGKNASRVALRKTLGLDSTSRSFKIQDFHHLQDDPRIIVSLSHTLKWGAAVTAQRPNLLSIGIDIEKSSRQIRPGTYKFFMNEEDDSTLTPLETWIRKEACFKAFFPLRGLLGNGSVKTWTLKDFWVNKRLFGLKNNKHCLGEVFSFTHKDILGACATIN